MGGPSQSDYEASPSEVMSANIAKKKADFFRQNYMPVMKAQLADAEMDMTGTIEGRANADIAQAVDSSGMAYDDAVTGRAQEELMRAKTMAGGEASRALDARNRAGTNIIGAAQGQQDVVGQARSQLANLDTQSLLSANENRMATRGAAINAAAQLGTAAILRARGNRNPAEAASAQPGSTPGGDPMVPVFQQFKAPSSFTTGGFNPSNSPSALARTSTYNPFKVGG